MATADDPGHGVGTSKHRAQSVEVHYLRTGYRRVIWVAAAIAIVVVWLWWGVLFSDDRGTTRLAPGDVAAVHASWEANCQACHVPFEPTGAAR